MMTIVTLDDRMKVLDIMNSVISEARSMRKENGPVTGNGAYHIRNHPYRRTSHVPPAMKSSSSSST